MSYGMAEHYPLVLTAGAQVGGAPWRPAAAPLGYLQVGGGAAGPRCVHLRRGSLARLLLLAGAFLLYLLLGAAVFSVLERPGEVAQVGRLREELHEFIRRHPCVSDDALEKLIVEVIRANNNGVSAARNVTMEPNWSFGQSFFFAGTIMTTIGYGHVSPLSDSGKAFCIAYAMLGIPLTLILITAVVERLLTCTTYLLQFLNSKLGHLYQPFNIRVFHLAIISSLVLVFMLIIPASIFAHIEPSWNYLDSFYYCFISLTTIGLGDYIPGDSPDQRYRPLYKVITTFYLFIGLTFMMLTLSILYDIPQLNWGAHFMMANDERELSAEAERLRLKTAAASGPKYTRHLDHEDMMSGGAADHIQMESPSPASTSEGRPSD